MKITLFHRSICQNLLIGGLIGGLICIGIPAHAEIPEGKFQIRWHLDNIPDSIKGIIAPFNPRMYVNMPITEITLHNGDQIYEDTVSGPKHLYFFGWVDNFTTIKRHLWVDKGGWIDICGDDKWVNRWTITTNIPQQQESLTYQDLTADEINRWLAMEDTITVRTDHYYQEIYTDLQVQMILKTLEHMKTAPVTEVWVDTFLEMAWGSTFYPTLLHKCQTTFQQLYARLPKAWRKTDKGRILKSFAYPAPTVGKGDKMVDAVLYDVDGNKHHLAEYTGGYLLLVFWQYLFPYRMEEFELKVVNWQYAERLEIVSICRGQKELWAQFLKTHPQPGIQLYEKEYGGKALSARYQATGNLDQYVLISPQGKILEMWSGYQRGSIKARLETWLE